MIMSKADDSFTDKLIEAIKELYVDVKIKYNCENKEDFKKNELEKMSDINVFKLIDYIKGTIDIYVNYKLDEARNSANHKNDKQMLFENNEEEVYEKMIKKLEADVRNHIKVEYELKLQNESLESKLEEYENVLDEMDKLQKKVEIYEKKLYNPEYLEMSKKENEILILRAENSNLKNSIATKEKSLENLKIKFSEYKSEKDKTLIKNQEIIHNLNKKIKKLEEFSHNHNNNLTISDKKEFYRNINNSNIKDISKTIVVQTSRKSSESSKNILNLFHSENKDKKTARKYTNSNEFMIINDESEQNNIIKNLLMKELSYENSCERSAENPKKKVIINKQRANSNVFEKINNTIKIQNIEKSKAIQSNANKNNIKRSSSVNDFNSNCNSTTNCLNNNCNNYTNSNSSNSNNNNLEANKSEFNELNEKRKFSLGFDTKTNNYLNNNSNMIFSQIFNDNNSNNSYNYSSKLNKFNNVTRSIEMNKTPVSGNSQNSINNFNNNNIIINNKFNSEVSKPITNLNMIFKFKTILNEDMTAKNHKNIKNDPTKIVRNPSNNKNSNIDKNENNKIIDNNRIIDSKKYNSSTKSNEKKELKNQNNNIFNKIKNNNNTARNMYDHDLKNQNPNIFNVNSTLKSGNYTSKNISKSSKINILKNFDPLKFSINQLQDLLSGENNNENHKSNNKSGGNSKGKVGNMGNNSKKFSSNI